MLVISTIEVESLIANYIAAWSEPDRATRLRLLQAAWAEDGVYTDPQSYAVGREGLADLIDGFFAQNPGAAFHLNGKIDHHHNHLRFFWTLQLPDGSQIPGMDYGEIAPDGKLRRIVGFFGR